MGGEYRAHLSLASRGIPQPELAQAPSRRASRDQSAVDVRRRRHRERALPPVCVSRTEKMSEDDVGSPNFSLARDPKISQIFGFARPFSARSDEINPK